MTVAHGNRASVYTLNGWRVNYLIFFERCYIDSDTIDPDRVRKSAIDAFHPFCIIEKLKFLLKLDLKNLTPMIQFLVSLKI